MANRLRTFTKCLGLIVPFLFYSFAHADLNDPCGCNVAIVPEVMSYSQGSNFRVAFLQQIDERQYEKIKKEGSADAELVDLVRGTANYSEFQERRAQKLSSTVFSLTAEQSQSLLFTTFRTREWSECKKQCIASQKSFFCGLSDLTETVFMVTCSWRPEGRASERQGVEVVADGTKLPARTILQNLSRDWQFPRDPDKTMLLTFEPEYGSSQSVKVERMPKIPPKMISTTTDDDRLVAHYALSGNAVDSSRHGNNGIVHGARPCPDRLRRANGALCFNGSGDYVSVKHRNWLGLGDSGTIAMWFRQDREAKHVPHFLIAKGSNAWLANYWISIEDPRNRSGRVLVLFGGGREPLRYEMTAFKPALGVWEHVAVTWNQGAIELYRNGSLLLEQRKQRAFPLNRNADPIIIGGRLTTSNWGEYFYGAISDVRIYDHLLSSREIHELAK